MTATEAPVKQTRLRWDDDLPEGVVKAMGLPDDDTGWPPAGTRCECGWRRTEPYTSHLRCPRCSSLLCDDCGHAEGSHQGDWVRRRTRCMRRGCGCEGFKSWALESIGDEDA